MLEIVRALERRELTRGLVPARRITRYGYPKNPEILKRAELFGSEELERLSQTIQAAHRDLKRLRETGAPERRIAEKTAEIQQLQEERRQAMADYIANASLVATTAAAITSGHGEFFNAPRWDTVIVDEASMIGGAILLLLAGRAQHSFLCVGDPRQLGPICEWTKGTPPSNVRRWVAQDPFEFVGLSSGEGLQRKVVTEDARVVRILCQRRCRSEIWSTVSLLYPSVLNQAGEGPCDKTPCGQWVLRESLTVLDVGSGKLPRKDALPSEGSEDRLAVEYQSACRKVGKSWQNPPTAMLAIDVARELRAHYPQSNVAIITPYRAQVRLIRRWLHEEVKSDPRRWLDGVEVGTVHAFQGGEADFVVFDLVDGAPREKVGMLLRGDAGVRLVNVAVTRARSKLVVIAHRAWFGLDVNKPHLGLLGRILFRDESSHVLRVSPASTSGRTGADNQRKPESPIEEKLVASLEERKPPLPPFVLQHRIYDDDGAIVSRADIAFVSQKVAVYCDGARYHLQQNQWQKDLRQRRKLVALGWTPIAFSGAEILADAASCVEEIAGTLQPSPSAAEAG